MYFGVFGNNLLYLGVQLMDLPSDGSCSPTWLAMRHEFVTLLCIGFKTVFISGIIFAWHIKHIKEIRDYYTKL